MSGRTKVELLAPAGNYEALIGAFHAGADAVYLGGDKFGARAYADNFTTEEICEALRYAHFLGKRIYLTVNTLIKENEFEQLYEYLLPLYEAGLDGVIIQDLGVWQYVHRTFPDLALHASTQMAITGTNGASFLEENGAVRIVPARELSLTEIKQIKEQTGLELECFIHGAMCYCYSGQCLFSSILGGRSGNRGRCAQPCRLPYQILNDEKKVQTRQGYPLSLKDMCTIADIPKLIEAGIDSFKIEGRMKKPEYAAGVTAIYRKYIDAYYEKGAAKYKVSDADRNRLQNLYIRSEIQTGYYERHNGREMITLQKPSYLGSDDALLKEIAETYLNQKQKKEVWIKGIFHVGEPAIVQIGTVITTGDVVMEADARPLDEAAITKQLSKLGNSYLQAAQIEIEMDSNVFMPIGKINELRRMAVEAYENHVIEHNGFPVQRKLAEHSESCQAVSKQSPAFLGEEKPQLHVSVQTLAQLRAVYQSQLSVDKVSVDRTSVDKVSVDKVFVDRISIDRVYIDSDFYLQEQKQIEALLVDTTEYYLALPYILRLRDSAYLQELAQSLSDKITGFLVRNLEGIEFVRKLEKQYDIITDTGIYQFNEEAVSFWNVSSKEGYLPYELNGKEYRQLIKAMQNPSKENDRRLSAVVYGTIPMMLTANCLKKTTNDCVCNEKINWMYLQDRYQTYFPVSCNCKHCYNIIYNSLPFSLHNQMNELCKLGLYAIRLDFTKESEEMIQKILGFYQKKEKEFPIKEYTTGHYKRGVE